jgi:hypothetical protein
MEPVDAAIIALGRSPPASLNGLVAPAPSHPKVAALNQDLRQLRSGPGRERNGVIAAPAEGPLRDLLSHDLGSDHADIAVGRICSSATLEMLARERGISRERVRQKLCIIRDVLDVRWPEGRAGLKGLLGASNASHGLGTRQAIDRLMDVLYGERLDNHMAPTELARCQPVPHP